MRVVFFTESLLPLVDGVSVTLAHLFASLEAAGVDFRVYAPFVPEEDLTWRRRVRRVRSFAFPLYRDYRVSLPGGRALREELERYDPDVVHVVSPTPMAVWAQRWARRNGVPVVGTFHTHFVSYFPYYGVAGLEGLGWWLLRRFYGRCGAVYAPSSTIVEELRRRGFENVGLWTRGVDTRRFSPVWRDETIRAAVGASDSEPLVLMVSRLVKEKDLLDLVGMDRELRRRGVRYRLGLVGDGPLRRRLERLLPGAYYAGHQSGVELARWYASGDVFVFPSTTETFANVVQEAMSSGLPAVVVDRGGPPGVIEPGRSGLVAKAKDASSLADEVERLVRDADLRLAMGRAARQRALERTWEAVNAVLIREYDRLATSRAGVAVPDVVQRLA